MSNSLSGQNMDQASVSPEIQNAELAYAVQQGELSRSIAEAYDAVETAMALPRPDQGYRVFKMDVPELLTHELDGIYLLHGDIFLRICAMSPAEQFPQTTKERQIFAVRLARKIRKSILAFYQDFWSEANKE